MDCLPINWHEGLFLQPHHFQAADRYWTNLVQTSERWDHPYGYGLEDISCGFQGTQFRVDRIRARMPNGTLVQHEGNAAPLTVDVKQAIDRGTPTKIFLCIPQLRPRESNIEHEPSGGRTRFRAIAQEIFDDTQSGGTEQMIECRLLNVRLLLETDDRSGFEQLPIAQVVRSASGDAAPRIDDQYIPPALSIAAWQQLGHGIVRGIQDLLVQRINELVELLRDVNLRDNILEVSQAGRFALLDRLNELSTTLGVMLPALGVHPLTAYAELCRIVSRISIYRREKRVPELPHYDHDNLGFVFHEVATLIRIILASIQFNDFMQENFLWKGDVMLAQLRPAWFDPRVDWYIGVDRGERASDTQCRQLLSTRNSFVWKFGANDQDIYRLAAVGLKLTEVDRVPSLPPHQYWSYWKVTKDEGDHVFHAVGKTQIVAAFIRDRKHHTFQPAQYAETSRFPIVDPKGDMLDFQLALFGVRR